MKKLLIIALLVPFNCHGMLQKLGMVKTVLMHSKKGSMQSISGLRFFSGKNINQDYRRDMERASDPDWGKVTDEFVNGLEGLAKARMQSSHDKNVTVELLQCQLKKYPDFPLYRLPIADDVLAQYTISKVLTNHSDHFVMALLLPKNNDPKTLPLVLEWSWQAIVDWNSKN